jgi:DNA primase
MFFLSNFIPEEKIEEIKNAADIVEVVSDYVILKKAGLNYIGLCPFHSEKTPSFTVSSAKQIFHCFGCNTGGNVFNFLMRHDGFSFPESVRHLAKRYGIALPEKSLSKAVQQKISEKERLFGINRTAMEFFQDVLLNRPQGREARKYLHKRKMAKSIVDNFKLGYAPPSWNSLLDQLLKKGFPLDLIETSGLAVPKKSKTGFYDRFRDRIIFPIFNLNQQIVGFGGRVLDDALPKYLNSPETPLYSKSRSLYGLHRARNACRETRSAYIVEGYFDLLALHQHGIENAVATLGTALTPNHIQLLKGLVEKIILVFDSDDAGVQASLRGVGIFIKEGVDARVVLLPKGHDPDSFLFEFGAAAFRKHAEASLGVMPFLIMTAEKKHGRTIDGKLKIIHELATPLASIEADARKLYIKELAERLSLEEYILLEKVREEKIRQGEGIQTIHRNNRFSGLGPNQQPQLKVKKQIGSRLERQIVSMMIGFPEILPEIVASKALDHFTSETLRSLGSVILKHAGESGAPLSKLMSMVDDDEKRSILASLAFKEELWNQRDCRKVITKLVQRSPKRYGLSLNEQIKAAEGENNQALLLQLLRKKQELAVSNEKQKMRISSDMG